MPLADCYCRKR